MSILKFSAENGDENRQAGIMATTIILTVIACIAVALRFATRIWIVRRVGWDDYTILFAILGVIIGCGLVIVQVHYGFGRHSHYLSKWQYIEYMKYSYGEWIQTFQTLMFTKISICLFLLRIPVENRFIRPIQGTIIILIVTNIVLTILWIVQCNPVPRAWNKKDKPGKCFTDAQVQRIIISQAIISIISDFVLALFPIVLLWKVQIAPRVKAGLCTLMGLGLITAAFCIVRTVLNWQNVNLDPSWESVDNWYWRSWEVCIGIVAACIPALRPGYRTVSASIASYISHRSSRKTSDVTLVEKGDHAKPSKGILRNALPTKETKDFTTNFPNQPTAYDPTAPNPAHAVNVEADRAKNYGAGEKGFAMHGLPGDKKTTDQGIKKVTTIDIDGTSVDGSEERRSIRDIESGLGHRDLF